MNRYLSLSLQYVARYIQIGTEPFFGLGMSVNYTLLSLARICSFKTCFKAGGSLFLEQMKSTREQEEA